MDRNRRGLLNAMGAALALPALAAAPALARGPVREIGWGDLVPEEGGIGIERLREMGVVQHGALSTPWDQDLGGQMTDEFDGQRVRLPGYLLPLDFDGSAVTDAILVPYVGACIHVPPPPPNQLVLIQTREPYVHGGLFEPVYATGLFASGAAATALAEIGYTMTDTELMPYA